MSDRIKLAVTGALGHIGSALIRALPTRLPVDLVLIDDLSTQRYAALFDLPAACRFHEADVTRDPLEPLFEGADAVVHLAAITDAPRSFARRAETERVNLGGTRRVAEAAAKVGAGLIFPSSTSVYGTQADVVDEDCAPEELAPQSPYAEIKLVEERALAALAERAGLKHVVCRFGTIFGFSPGMRFHTAVNKFCWQATFGTPLTVWRTALDQKRPYLDLRDAVAAVAHIVERRLFDGRVYNVLTANHTVRDVVGAIRATVPDLQVELVDARIMNQLSYDVSDARIRATGFTPRGDLESGVGETLRRLAAAAGRGA